MNDISKAEQLVINYLIQGYSNDEIGTQLCVSEKTVKFHLTNIYKKHEVKSRTELISKLSGNPKPVQEERVQLMNHIKANSNLPASEVQVATTQQDKIKFIDQQFKVGNTVTHLHHMMMEVTKEQVNPATVNAACNCVARLNETINTAIQAARFLSER